MISIHAPRLPPEINCHTDRPLGRLLSADILGLLPRHSAKYCVIDFPHQGCARGAGEEVDRGCLLQYIIPWADIALPDTPMPSHNRMPAALAQRCLTAQNIHGTRFVSVLILKPAHECMQISRRLFPVTNVVAFPHCDTASAPSLKRLSGTLLRLQ
jgi:hypothetical protein